jgi:adenylate cyclase class IV
MRFPDSGSFIELEAIASPDSDLADEYRQVTELRTALGITDERILAVGYSDELLRLAAH